MMPVLRTAFLAAAVVALLSAPAAVSAKANELSAASVSPISGTTSTTFVFRVHYTGFAAQSVSVTVAGRNLRMSRVSGSATDGVFGVSGRLPAGRWSVTFSASADKGPQATLSGPTVTVSAPTVAPAPSASPPPRAPSATPTPRPTAAQTSTQSTQQSSAKPTPAAGSSGTAHQPGTAATDAPAVAGTGATRSTPGATGASPNTAAGSTDGRGSGTTGTRGSPPGATISGQSLNPGGSAAGSPLPGPAGSAVWDILLVGLLSVGTVAMGGTVWLMLGRRRQAEAAGEGRSTGEMDAGAIGLGLGAEGRDPIFVGREAQRSRLESADDPILEAMGLNLHEGQRPMVRGSQVNAGPGVRPPLPPRRG